MGSPEDYLRGIYELSTEGDENTSTSEIAEHLDVSDASASEAVQKLEEEGLACRAPYKGFTLSPIGKEKAKNLTRKHQILTKFFKEIGVEYPEEEADRAEHAIKMETAKKIRKEISDQ